MPERASLLFVLGLVLALADQKPQWCRDLPRPQYAKLERISIPDPWFEAYKIRPGVFAIYEPHQGEEVISYLITGSKRALLFDTGMGVSDIKKAAAGLSSLPVSILNSHTHNDHIGDNWRFTEIYAVDTGFTRENAKGSTADAQAEITPDQLCGELPRGFDARSYATKPFRVTHWIHDGAKIDLGGRVLEVIAAPGHTPDSIALWDAKNGLLFTGDTYYAGPIYLYRPETDLDAYVASVKRLAALPKVQLLLPAHNVPVGNPADLTRVIAAMQEVRAGKLKPVPRDGKSEYKFEGFSFLMKQ
jgi:glyoxylase-like metal-dependent hydrolase (beta-lactamase superfamily II)